MVGSNSLIEDKDRAVIHGTGGDGVDGDDGIRIDCCWVDALVEQLCVLKNIN